MKRYVDRRWPELTGDSARNEAALEDTPGTSRGQRRSIRHLLARRLTRLNRGAVATPYFPPEWRETHARFVQALISGRDAKQGARRRARALFAAATLARTNGLELLATEVQPDWAFADADFELDLTLESRTGAFQGHPAMTEDSESPYRIVRPRADELDRARRHPPDPDVRFHYRYRAASLAWDAASLLPNHDPEKALMLHTGGSWLMNRDPKTADRFYKALVRTCGDTELGAAAGRQRWFPSLDAQGRPLPPNRQPSPPGTGADRGGDPPLPPR